MAIVQGLRRAFEHVPAVIAALFPGIAAGPALTRLPFGDVNPTGKLVVSWPRTVGQEPLHYNALSTGRPPENVDLSKPPSDVPTRYVSRYIDEEDSPQFPFGYGLSYTIFLYGQTTINTDHLSALQPNRGLSSTSGTLTAETDVMNNGPRAGEETVQLYIGLRGTSTVQPVRSLKGFRKVSLAPGETKRVQFELPPDTFAIWNNHNEFAAEPAKVRIWISSDSSHGTATNLQILP